LRYKESLEKIQIIRNPFLNFRLQREEEEAFASSQSSQGAQSLTFSKFEEKKTNEKTRKVTTVKKFFSASSRVGSKKGNFLFSFIHICIHYLGHFSSLSRALFLSSPLPSLPGRTCFALFSNFVEEKT
jgi:hypothetical protein